MAENRSNPVVVWQDILTTELTTTISWSVQGESESDICEYAVYVSKNTKDYVLFASVPLNCASQGIYTYEINLGKWDKISCYVIGYSAEKKVFVRSEIKDIVNTSQDAGTITENPFEVELGSFSLSQKNIFKYVIRLKTEYWDKIKGCQAFLKGEITNDIYFLQDLFFVYGTAELSLWKLNLGVLGEGNNDVFELHLYPILFNGEVSQKVFQFPLGVDLLNMTAGIDKNDCGLIPVFGRTESGVVIRVYKTDPSIRGVRILKKNLTVGEECFSCIRNLDKTEGAIYLFGTDEAYVEILDYPVYEWYQMMYSISPLTEDIRDTIKTSPFVMGSLLRFTNDSFFSPEGEGFYTLEFKTPEKGKEFFVARGRILGGYVYWEDLKSFTTEEDKVIIEDGVLKSSFDKPFVNGAYYAYRRCLTDNVAEQFNMLLSTDFIINTAKIMEGVVQSPRSVKYIIDNEKSSRETTKISIVNEGTLGIDHPKSYVVQYINDRGEEKEEEIHGEELVLKGRAVGRVTVIPVDLAKKRNVDKKIVIENLTNLK